MYAKEMTTRDISSHIQEIYGFGLSEGMVNKITNKIIPTIEKYPRLLMDEGYHNNVVKPIMYNYIRYMDIFRRNAAIALGNSGNSQHIPALKKAFAYGNPELEKILNWSIEKLFDSI